MDDDDGIPLEEVQAEQEKKELLDLISDTEKNWDMFLDNRLAGDTMRSNVKSVTTLMKWAVREDRDAVCVNSSHKRNGLGKSALSYWQSREMDKNFQIERNFFFRGGKKDMEKFSDTIPKFAPIVMDEIIRMLYKRRSTSSDSIDFVEWLAADQRKTNQPLIGNIPDFWDVDKYLREGKVWLLVEVLERGVGVVFEADSFPKIDPWHEKEFDEIIKKRKKGKREDVLDQIRLLKQHWCYKGPIFWADFPKEDKKEYLRCVKHFGGVKEDDSIAQKEKDREAAKSRAGFAVVRAVQLMMKRLGASKAGILREIGMTDIEYRRYYEGMQEEAGKQTGVAPAP